MAKTKHFKFYVKGNKSYCVKKGEIKMPKKQKYIKWKYKVTFNYIALTPILTTDYQTAMNGLKKALRVHTKMGFSGLTSTLYVRDTSKKLRKWKKLGTYKYSARSHKVVKVK